MQAESGSSRHRNNDRLIVFADDWGRHPSSCQHLVRHLLSERSVMWINTIGTRAPTLSPDLLRRGVQKLCQWGSSGAPEDRGLAAAPVVYNPLMYPGFRSRWQRGLNASLLAGFMRKHMAPLSDAVVLSTVPITADLPGKLDARRWVYYCVDDFSVWPGLDSGPMQAMEQEFVKRADRLIAAGDNLADRLLQMGRKAQVISHGIDLEHWTGTDADADLLDALPRPIILFWGLVDQRLDVQFLTALNRSLQAGCIALVGPQQDPDPAVVRLSRVRLLGSCAYEKLPALARAASVLVMPYADLPVTRAMQPLKLKEYLATGRPVVVSRLPALRGWEEGLDVADTAEDFAAKVLERLNGQVPQSQVLARSRLKDETWKAKSARLADVLFGD